MPWVLAMTRPNCEALASYNLEAQGYEHYLPIFLLRRPNRAPVRKPLFPRYIFIHIDQRWYSLLGTKGISRVLLGDTGPLTVADNIIESIRSREDSNGLVMLERKPKFAVGTKLKAKSGPLAGHELFCDGMRGDDRVLVLVNMLGRQVKTELPENVLILA